MANRVQTAILGRDALPLFPARFAREEARRKWEANLPHGNHAIKDAECCRDWFLSEWKDKGKATHG